MVVSNVQDFTTMSDVTNAINALIVVLVGGLAGVFATIFGIMKWYLPKRFEQQTAERAAQLEKLKMEVQTNNAQSNADIERDRVLPQLVTGINSFALSNSQMTQNVGKLIQNRLEQDARMAGEFHAHTLAITGVTEGLDELRGEFHTLQKSVEKAVTQVGTNTQVTRDAKVSSDSAAAQASITLELVRSFGIKLDTITEAAKHDTGEIVPINLPQQIDVTLHTATPAAADTAADGEAAA